jgi:hypothetical protein
MVAINALALILVIIGLLLIFEKGEVRVGTVPVHITRKRRQ